MPALLEKEPVSLIHGAVVPLEDEGGQVWQKEDEYAHLQGRFAAWIQEIGRAEELSKTYVYENPNLTYLDLRQHRQLFYHLLSVGEEIAVDLIVLKAEEVDSIKNFVLVIDQKLGELRKRLFEWHGDLQLQKDIPEDFKKGVRDIKEGKVVDLDTALTSPHNGVKV